MVLDDRSAFAFYTSKRERPRRHYGECYPGTRPIENGSRRSEPSPIEERIKKWLKRISKIHKAPIVLSLPQKLKKALGLPTSWVELREDGTLWPVSKTGDDWQSAASKPIATFEF